MLSVERCIQTRSPFVQCSCLPVRTEPGGGIEAYEVPDRCSFSLTARVESVLLASHLCLACSSGFTIVSNGAPLTSTRGAGAASLSSWPILQSKFRRSVCRNPEGDWAYEVSLIYRRRISGVAVKSCRIRIGNNVVDRTLRGILERSTRGEGTRSVGHGRCYITFTTEAYRPTDVSSSGLFTWLLKPGRVP